MRRFVVTVSAFALIAAASAGAALAGDAKTKPAETSTFTAPPAKVDTYKKASQADIQSALRDDPLKQAAYFSDQFEHDPTNAQIGICLSNALRTLGRYQEAADTAHSVLLFAPDNTDALVAAARAHIGGGQGFYAIDQLEHLSKLKPNDWQAYSLLGVAYDQTKRPDDAQTAWATALKLSPNNPAVLTNIAMSKVAGGDFVGAEPLLRTAVAQKSSTLQERQNLALVLGLEGKMAEAEKLLRQDLPPDAADANLAWLQQSLQTHAAPDATPVAAAPQAPTSRSWASVKAAGS